MKIHSSYRCNRSSKASLLEVASFSGDPRSSLELRFADRLLADLSGRGCSVIVTNPVARDEAGLRDLVCIPRLWVPVTALIFIGSYSSLPKLSPSW